MLVIMVWWRARVGSGSKIFGNRFLWRKSSSEMTSRSIGIGGEAVCSIPFDVSFVSVVTDLVPQLMVKRKTKPPWSEVHNPNYRVSRRPLHL